MEEQKDMSGLLERVMQPAFCVKDGIIILVNQAARQILIQADTPVTVLLGDASEEYNTFEGGCLCMTLEFSGRPHQISITRMEGFDLFVFEQAEEQAELRAMALTALGLREPLSDIIAVTDQLFPTVENIDDPLTQARVCRMNRRLNQLHRIVCNMTDAIQYASDTLPRMTCQDICSVMEEIFDHARELITSSGFHLTYSGPRDSIYCMICAERLERAVYNMLSNSMKYADPGSLIEAKLSSRNGKVYISVQDNGRGIPSSMLGKVFTRYQRQPGLEDPLSGLGLGMVLVRGTAAAHGGTVLINQPNGSGTRITMSLAIRRCHSNTVRSNTLHVDYAGERDHGLLELSDVLPPEFYAKN